VLPSLNEGFGSTLVEAMACGAPAIVADAGALPEVAGDGALLFPPGEPETLAGLLRRVLNEPSLAADLSARGRARARAFDWSHVASRTYAVYQETLFRHGGRFVPGAPAQRSQGGEEKGSGELNCLK
jgi:glycosyltransferase involved in cell wall biosynthesis